MIARFDNTLKYPRWNGQQRRIGLTGGIASGKSAVGRFLSQDKSLPILDADKYAHEALAPGTPTTEIVISRYGKKIIMPTQNVISTIDRSALAKIIFNDKAERFWLENIVHPEVKKKINSALKENAKEPLVVLIIPLLFEANLAEICSEIWLVDCKPDQQCQRLMRRDHISESEAKKRISTQWPMRTKRSLADVIIDNSRQVEAWVPEVEALI